MTSTTTTLRSKALRIALALLLVVSGLIGSLSVPKNAYAASGSLSDVSWDEAKGDIESLMGTPYVYGGRSLSGWDCSGFVSYVMHDIYGTAWPGGSWGDSGTEQIESFCSGYEVASGSSASAYNSAFDNGTIKPGDIIIFSNSWGGTVHAAIAGESQTIYHAYSEHYGTCHMRFDEVWGYDGGHGKVYASYVVYRGLAEFGHISLTKTSAIPDISLDNSCYSLEGAVYTVYSNSGCTSSVGSITTDANGNGTLEDLKPGTYYVKETTPAPGFALDEAVYEVQVRSSKTTPVNGGTVADIPQSDPVGMLVAKIDVTTGKAAAQGNATLAGAEFTVNYYDGHYATAEEAQSSSEPTRSWVFATDGDGFAYYHERSLVAGDNLYHASNGDATLPLGTITVVETKAPAGYNLDDGYGNAPKTFCVQITQDGTVGETIYSYNSPTSSDTVKRGDFRLVKEVPVEVYGGEEGDEPQEQKRILVPGVKFQLINDTDNSVVSPETGLEVAPGGVVCTITVDKNGLATTKDDNASVNGWSKPADWNAALAYGTYIVHEVIPEDVAADFKAAWGQDLVAVDDWKITITDEGQYDAPALVTNKIPQTPLKIQKVDAETGKQIPLSCSFQLKDKNGELVTYTSRYPEINVMDTWTTNMRGEVTLPMLLEQGAYTITEVQAPHGYVLALEGLTFEVGAVYNNWDNPIVVNFADMPQKGTISVHKADSSTGEDVDDSTYIIKAAADIVTPDGTVRAKANEIVATLVTDATGTTISPELYLGSYIVYEAKAKEGFALDTVEKIVTLEYQGQHIAVFNTDLEVTDEPTVVTLKKVDAFNPETSLAGAVFHFWNDEGTYDEELITDENGLITIKYVPHGTFHMQEVEAPEGYIINDLDKDGNVRIHDFVVNDQGMIEIDDSGEMNATHEFTFENMPKTMKTTATDEASGTHEGQAREDMHIIDVIEYTGLVPGNEYKVSGVLMDKETAEPALDAAGKEITTETTFIAEDFCGMVEIEFVFDGSNLAGKQVVAFETMTFEDTEYMVHADIDDEGQTVRVVDIKTQAHLPESDEQTTEPAEKLELVDTVSYEGLTPGNTYKLITSLYDAETGEPLTDEDGSPVTAATTFVPEAASGTVDVAVTIDASQLDGKKLVFFEKLANENDIVIAMHEDLKDEGQTIAIEKPEEPGTPGKGFPQTGDHLTPLLLGLFAAIALSGATVGIWAWRKHRAPKDDVSDSE